MLSKILKLDALVNLIKKEKKAGKQVVFTNGCFDIMHAGHVRYLDAARSEGDLLVVGLNSDESVKIIKGSKRPVVLQKFRAQVLAGLQSVDYITVFNEPDPLKLIMAINPDVLVKGADWDADNIIGADFVRSNHGKVVTIPLVRDISTTNIIKKILRLYA